MPSSAPLPDGPSPASDSAVTEWRATFDFPGSLATVPESREQVLAFIEAHCHHPEDQLDWLVAVQEALANAALHGCKDDPAKRFQCEVVATPHDVTVTVSDPGVGFDVNEMSPEKFRATTLTHGRGIQLMRSLVDELAFARGGSEIRLRKRNRPQ